MSLTVLITRPERSALQLADTLRTRWGCGVEMVVSPVLEIEPTGETVDLDNVQTLIFTSQHGVSAFCDASDRRDLPCYVVGPATADTARAAGLKTVQADGDAKALIHVLISAGATPPFLHIRGTHVTGDLAQTLEAEGLPTVEAVLYSQVEQRLNERANDCLTRGTPVILPLFSPRSAKILFSQVHPAAQLYVAAISPNVAANVPEAVVNSLLVAEKPNSDAMLTVLDQAFEQAKRLEGANRAK
ncbi:MAG: uroporphyrinogen-III synthase [Roseovarius sp.]